MRIATWNVNSLKARLPRVEEWLADVSPDVVCLQETKLADGAFPSLAFQALGYESVHHGYNQWNGVAILSRVGLEDVETGFPGMPGVGKDGAPADAERLEFVRLDGGTGEVGAVAALRTDADGSFRLALTPGRYRVAAREPDQTGDTLAEVDVERGVSKRLRLTLPR